MIAMLTSFLLSGLVAYAMLFAFFALVPRVVPGRSSILSFSLQWLLIAVLALPAIAVAYFGPSWLYEVPFGRVATKDQRTWLIIGGIALLGPCFVIALRSSAGKRYSQWRAGSPDTSLEHARRSVQPLGDVGMYPSLLRRYLSTVIDYAVIFGLLFAFAKSSLYDPNATEATIWPLWLFVVYEPVLTTVACTPGQLAMNFRVRRVSGFGRPAIHRTFLRWLVKGLLGVVSILFLPRQKQRRALHDLASGTIVLNGTGPFGAPPNKSLARAHGR